MEIRFWGVRGELPSPLTTAEIQRRLAEAVTLAVARLKQDPTALDSQSLDWLPFRLRRLPGGETSCIEIKDGTDRLIVNLGTGARRLGYDLMAAGAKGSFKVILTGTEWHRIQGWPFFVPGFIPGNVCEIYSCYPDMEARLVGQQEFEFFPVTFKEMASTREFRQIGSTPVSIGSFQVSGIRSGAADVVRIVKDSTSLVVCDVDGLNSPDAAGLFPADMVILQKADIRNRKQIEEMVSGKGKRVLLTDFGTQIIYDDIRKFTDESQNSDILLASEDTSIAV